MSQIHDVAYKPFYDATADRIESLYGVRPTIDPCGPFSYDELSIECIYRHPTLQLTQSIRVSRLLIDHNFDLAVGIISGNITNAFKNYDIIGKYEGVQNA
jgi:hypothetical protein